MEGTLSLGDPFLFVDRPKTSTRSIYYLYHFENKAEGKFHDVGVPTDAAPTVEPRVHKC